jgi:hypothetical protein
MATDRPNDRITWHAAVMTEFGLFPYNEKPLVVVDSSMAPFSAFGLSFAVFGLLGTGYSDSTIYGIEFSPIIALRRSSLNEAIDAMSLSVLSLILIRWA